MFRRQKNMYSKHKHKELLDNNHTTTIAIDETFDAGNRSVLYEFTLAGVVYWLRRFYRQRRLSILCSFVLKWQKV